MRIVITRNIQTSITLDHGLDAGPIGNLGPEARQETRSSWQEDFDPMVQRWKRYLQDKDFYLCHVPGKEVYEFVPDALPRLCDNHMPEKKATSSLLGNS